MGVTEGVLPGQKLSPRVWRWISTCERYFAVAITRVVKPDGQDEALQVRPYLAPI